MSTSRPFALNTGSTISGTTQIGNIAIGDNNTMDFSTDPGGVKWWMGPDESSGYLIVVPDLNVSHGSQVGMNAGIAFKRSTALTEESFLELANSVSGQQFTGYTDATTWLTNSGFPASYPYEMESVSLFARMTEQPSAGLKTLINTTIKGLKDDGVWDLGDCLYIRGVHSSQASTLNWIKNAHNSTYVNSPIFSPTQGMSGESGIYIKNDYRPYSDAINFRENAASLFSCMRKLQTTNGYYILGSVNGAGNIYQRFYTAGNERCTISHNSYSYNFSINEGDIWGLVRTGGNHRLYLNGDFNIEAAKAIVSPLTNYEVYELGINSVGTVSALCDGTLFFSFYGGYLTDAQVTSLYTRIRYFYNTVTGLTTTGDELVLNGGFDSSTGWTVSDGWAITGGTATWLGYGTQRLINDNSNVIQTGHTYNVSFDITGTTGTPKIYFSDSAGSAAAFANRSYMPITNGSYNWLCIGNINIDKLGVWSTASFSGTFQLDNLSIKELMWT